MSEIDYNADPGAAIMPGVCGARYIELQTGIEVWIFSPFMWREPQDDGESVQLVRYPNGAVYAAPAHITALHFKMCPNQNIQLKPRFGFDRPTRDQVDVENKRAKENRELALRCSGQE